MSEPSGIAHFRFRNPLLPLHYVLGRVHATSMRALVAALALCLCAGVGCSAIVGIEDVPSAGSDSGADGSIDMGDAGGSPDGALDASGDVSSDASCESGVEDCSNGKDDNCDGLVDCADPSCRAAGFVCAAPPPSGWSGPVAFAAATGSTIPACSGAYGTLAASGHAGPNAPAASCGCACPSQASGTQCGGPTVDVYSGNSCNNRVESVALTANVCGNFTNVAGSVNAPPLAPTAPGSCAATPSKSVPPLTWSNSFALCGQVGPTGGGCSASAQCVAAPGSSFAPKSCIYQAGDVACPGAPYTQKTTFTTSQTDTRDCTACTCTPTGGSCRATITGWTGASCTGTSVAFSTDGNCAGQAASVVSAQSPGVTVTAASCVASGGQSTGGVTASAPVTVCCPP